jgi:hypothetical protein
MTANVVCGVGVEEETGADAGVSSKLVSSKLLIESAVSTKSPCRQIRFEVK